MVEPRPRKCYRPHVLAVVLRLPAFWLLLLLSSPFETASAQALYRTHPVSKGELDLKNWNREEPIHLSGQWLFAPGETLTPAEFHARWRDIPETLQLAASGQSFRQHNERKFPRNLGFGTYGIHLKNLRHLPGLEILHGQYHTAAAGVFVCEHAPWLTLAEQNLGTYHPERSRSLPTVNTRQRMKLTLDPACDSYFLILQISNHHYLWGGMWTPPTLAPASFFADDALDQERSFAFILGILVFVLFYSILCYRRRKEDRTALILAMISFLLILRLGTEYASYHATEPTPFGIYIAVHVLLLSSVLWVSSLSLECLRLQYPRQVPQLLVRMSLGLTGLVTLLMMAIRPFDWLDPSATLLIWSILHWLMASMFLFRAYNKKRRFILLNFIGIAAASGGVILDAMFSLGLLEYRQLPCTEYGYALLVTMQAQIIAARLHRSYQKAEYLSRHLQREVDTKTETLREQHSQLLEQQTRLSKALQALKYADETKTVFFRQISHELRTPLTLILGSLSQGRKSGRWQEAMETADKNAKRLLRLVNQLLDYQRMAAGRQTIHLTPVDLRDFVQHTASFIYSSCEERNIRFRVEDRTPPGSKAVILGQTDTLEKIVFNFLSNALKYTEAGGRISLILELVESHVRITVKDSGCGISQEDQVRLFQVFSRVRDVDKRLRDGTGIGLALAKELTEALQGSIGVVSEVGQGASFWVTFPSRPDLMAPLASELRSPDEQPLKLHFADLEATRTNRTKAKPTLMSGSSKILVVDDVADLRTMIRRMLEEHSYAVIECEDGSEAWDILKEGHMVVDLVITDWMMPRMSGPELIDHIRAKEKLASTPVILLTARSDEESRSIATKRGATSYLGKPFDEMELLSLVQNLLELKKSEKKILELNRYISENVLQRFLPPEIVKDILAGHTTLDEKARAQNITVLFCDLCNFTRMTHQLGPERIAEILDSFLVGMTEVVFEHRGTVDKFLGDGVLVLFGAPTPMTVEDQIRAATNCALAMHERLAELNAEGEGRIPQNLSMRIGIHHGPAVVGSFGGPKRSDFTAIGDAVNLAARIQQAAQPNEILVSEAIVRHLTMHQYRPNGRFELKGFDQAVSLFALKEPNQKQAS
jgi:signal transduction histidine kinase/class 3 adenylate cyclase/CheY-like chemotaxis protein